MAHHYAVVTTRTFLPYDSSCSIKLKKAKVLPTGNCPIEEKLAYSDDCPDGRVEMGKTGHTSLLQVGECSFARKARSFGSEHPEFRESAALPARPAPYGGNFLGVCKMPTACYGTRAFQVPEGDHLAWRI